MPSPNSIRAGSAFVELYVRDKVTTGLTKAAASLKAFSRVADRVGMQMMRTGAMMAVPIAVAGLRAPNGRSGDDDRPAQRRTKTFGYGSVKGFRAIWDSYRRYCQGFV